MLVSFTLTPMLSSRFLKVADAEADHEAQEHGFLHALDMWYSRRVAWALDHPGIIIGLSAIVCLFTIPLNRMVGREFVPNEDMGEWTIHKEGQEQYPVKIRVLEEQRRDVAEIGRLTVPGANGPVQIDNLARVERGVGPSHLQRSNRQFTVNVIADVAPGHALDEASNDVRAMLAGLHMPPAMSFRLQGQSKILDETTANLILAISLAMIFVYMVLAAQFESFLQPIVIMLALPIAVPFALLTLWLTDRTLNLWSALGMFLLLGIVKKNSILQVDYANKLRAQGMPLREAVLLACHTRLRPILMTTAAIIAGLVPTALGIGIGGTGRAAIAVTIIGGQALCLLLTLLLVPVGYVKLDELEQSFANQRLKTWFGKLAASTRQRLRPAQEGRP
jgi:HAE1 family hydrophobic/amphiphilic exporter-1